MWIPFLIFQGVDNAISTLLARVLKIVYNDLVWKNVSKNY